ncbi:cupin-like domain-containing protein [uncultured Erythrobacter sp.]|uniref:cupin-like domain-containing protein n=1 Tax=uncultured Erythrobacter sp. TaxID=263913 RepID=UPI0026161C14|nr:cupin-like domain-containing protein [uncultured Erythrobacter sp.]
MNAHSPSFGLASVQRSTFDDDGRQTFAKHYPEGPHRLRHHLGDHCLLELDALAELAEALPDTSVEYNRGDLPIGIDGKPRSNGLTIAETIRQVAKSNSWAVLKNVEQAAPYKALLTSLLDEISVEIEAKTGALLTPQAYIFISSPNAVTPYHFDPEHNILLQIRGSKTMTQFPAGDARFAADEVHEGYHTGGPRELSWDESFMNAAQTFPLEPGEAVYVPVMAPHFVRNGPQSSVSLSITWRSEWSYAESETRAFNHILRKFGLTPKAPSRWPQTNRAKSLGFRVLRKAGLAG